MWFLASDSTLTDGGEQRLTEVDEGKGLDQDQAVGWFISEYLVTCLLHQRPAAGPTEPDKIIFQGRIKHFI